MTYTQERERFIARVIAEGLTYETACVLLRQATTINRLAELACDSEAADRDRIPCPATKNQSGKFVGPCLCDRTADDEHETVPRIRVQDWNAERRACCAVPAGWRVITEGDPRGYTLRVIPPNYAARNAGRDRHNLDSIGVPHRESRERF